MAQVTVVGYQEYDFTGRDGRQVKGKNLYVLENEEKQGLVGRKATKIKVPMDFDLSKIKIDEEYNPYFDQYGRLLGLD